LRSVIPDIGPSDVVFLLAGYISPAWIFSHPQAAHYLNYDCSMRLVDEVESAADTNTVAGIVKATAIQIHVLVSVTLSHAFYCGLARLRALGHEGRYAIMCADAVWLAMPSMHHCGLLARGRRDRVPHFRRGLHRASAGGHFANVCENVRLRGSSPGRP